MPVQHTQPERLQSWRSRRSGWLPLVMAIGFGAGLLAALWLTHQSLENVAEAIQTSREPLERMERYAALQALAVGMKSTCLDLTRTSTPGASLEILRVDRLRFEASIGRERQLLLARLADPSGHRVARDLDQVQQSLRGLMKTAGLVVGRLKKGRRDSAIREMVRVDRHYDDLARGLERLRRLIREEQESRAAVDLARVSRLSPVRQMAVLSFIGLLASLLWLMRIRVRGQEPATRVGSELLAEPDPERAPEGLPKEVFGSGGSLLVADSDRDLEDRRQHLEGPGSTEFDQLWSTRRRPAEEERALFFERAPAMFCIIEPEGKLAQINSLWTAILGWNADELTGRLLADLIHREDWAPLTAELDRLRHGQDALELETRFLCKDGSHRWLFWFALVASEAGRIHAVAHDVTDRKQVDRQLQKSLDESRRISRLKTDLIESVSLGLSHAVGEWVRSGSTEIPGALGRILGLLQDLLESGGMEAWRPRQKPRRLDLDRVLELAADLASADEDPRSLTIARLPGAPRWVIADPGWVLLLFRFMVSPRGGKAEAGPLILELARFHDSGREVGLELTLREPGADAGDTAEEWSALPAIRRLSAALGGGTRRVSLPSGGHLTLVTLLVSRDRSEESPPSESAQTVLVLDQDEARGGLLLECLAGDGHRCGLATSPEEAASQAASLKGVNGCVVVIASDDVRESRDSEWIDIRRDPGLGQAAWIRSSGGRIVVSRLLRQIRSFRFSPAPIGSGDPEEASLDVPAAAPCPSTPPPVCAARGRVLLAEDNSVNQLFAVRLLEKFNCRVDVASDGMEALARLAETAYDVVLMDCRMPRLDGFEATRQIRGRGGGRAKVPIIGLTANATEEDRQDCLAAGMDDFVGKPVDPRRLRAALSRWIELAADDEVPHDPVVAGSSGSTGEEVLIDEKVLEGLSQLPSKEGEPFLLQAFRLFRERCALDLASLEEAREKGDSPSFRLAAHSMKGSCRDLGVLRLAALCQELESLGAAGELSGADTLIEEVRGELRRVEARLNREAARLGSEGRG